MRNIFRCLKINRQFGRLMGMGDHTFSVMFVRYLLSRQLITKKKYELWWLYAGKPIRYGVNEFALVTGLNCGPPPMTERTRKRKRETRHEMKRTTKGVKGGGRMWRELFGEFKKPTPAWLLEKLLMGRKYKDPLTRFRLALLLLVEGLLCPTSGSMYLDSDVVEMVSDVEGFLTYPWGRKSFLLTVQSAKARTPAQFVQETTAIQGFPHAMVLLTASCCPEIISGKCRADLTFGVGDNVAELVGDVVKNCSYINVVSAKNLDQQGQAEVRSLIATAGGDNEDEIRFEDEEKDDEVDHLVALIKDDFPFEHNSWRGGVKADEAEVSVTSLSDSGDADVGPDDSINSPPDTEVRRSRELRCGPIPVGIAVTQRNVERPGGVRTGCGEIDEIITRVAEASHRRALAVWQSYVEELKDHMDAAVGKLRNDINGMLGEGIKLSKPTTTVSDGLNPASIPISDPVAGPSTYCPLVEKGRSDGTSGRRKSVRKVSNGGSCFRPRTRNQKAAAASMTAADGTTSSMGRKRKGGGCNGSGPADIDFSNEVSGAINVSSPEKSKTEDSDALDLEGMTVESEVPSFEEEKPISSFLRRRAIPHVEVLNAITPQHEASAEASGGKSDGPATSPYVGLTTEGSDIIVGTGFKPFKLPDEEKVNDFRNAVIPSRSIAIGNDLQVQTELLNSMFDAVDVVDEKTLTAVVMWIEKRDASAVRREYEFLTPSCFELLRSEYVDFILADDKRTYVFRDSALVRTLHRFGLGERSGSLYFPLNIGGRHWVGFVLDMNVGKIFVLDCNTACVSYEELCLYVAPVAEMVPYVLLREGSEVSRTSLSAFPVERVDISSLCEVPGLSAIAAVVLMELHSSKLLSHCEPVSEFHMRTAAMNYAIEVMKTFNTECGGR